MKLPAPTAGLERFVELERSAQEYLSFEPEIIPGLLQTEAYARTIAEIYLPERTDDERESLVAFKLDRQRILDRLHVHAVIGDDVLTSDEFAAEVMIEQLEALSTSRKNVTLQVAPTNCLMVISSPFIVMRFDTGVQPDLVYLERRGDEATYLGSAPDVELFTNLFTELAARSLDEEGSRERIREVIGWLK